MAKTKKFLKCCGKNLEIPQICSKNKEIPKILWQKHRNSSNFVAKTENSHEVESFINKWVNIVDSVEIQKELTITAFDNLRNEEQLNINDDNFDYKCNQPWAQMSIYSFPIKQISEL